MINENSQVRTGQFLANAAGREISCLMSAPIPSVPPDVVSYTPPPFDVLSIKDDAAVEQFLNFPLTVLP